MSGGSILFAQICRGSTDQKYDQQITNQIYGSNQLSIDQHFKSYINRLKLDLQIKKKCRKAE